MSVGAGRVGVLVVCSGLLVSGCASTADPASSPTRSAQGQASPPTSASAAGCTSASQPDPAGRSATTGGICVLFTNNTSENVDVTTEFPSASKTTLTPGLSASFVGQSGSGYDVNGQVWFVDGTVIGWQGYAPIVGYPSVLMDDTRYRLSVDESKQGASKGHGFKASRPANYFVRTKRTSDGQLKNLYRATIDVALTS